MSVCYLQDFNVTNIDDDIKLDTILTDKDEKIDDFPENEQHLCLLCGAKYSVQMDLMKHIANEHDIKFECHICKNLFRSDAKLR